MCDCGVFDCVVCAFSLSKTLYLHFLQSTLLQMSASVNWKLTFGELVFLSRGFIPKYVMANVNDVTISAVNTSSVGPSAVIFLDVSPYAVNILAVSPSSLCCQFF